MFWVSIAVACLLAALPTLAADTDESNANEHDSLTTLVSWTETLAAAKERRVPIVLLVEQRHCGFCQALKKEVFRPLANDPAFSGRALFVSVLTDYGEEPVEKDGVEISGFEFSEQLEADTTPTILFFDYEANELQQRVVGYVGGPEYELELIERIEASIEVTRKRR